MTLSELWLVRHGESRANVAATQADLAGWDRIPIEERDADVVLSSAGVEQAEALGRWLSSAPPIDRFWVSPYARAGQTLLIAHGGRDLAPVVVDERLRDRELGILDLLTRTGVERLHPEEAERRRHLGKFYHRPPGGESWADVALRLRSFLRDIRPEDRTAMIVAHDAVVMLLLYLLLPLDEESLLEFAASHTVLNASVTHLRLDGDRWELVAFSDVEHIQISDAPVTVHAGDPDVLPE